MPLGLIIDNFAGGGGASTGIEAALGRPIDIAINHDPAAIEMHTANHPHTLHLQEDVFKVSPVQVCKGRPVDVAWFSPDCTHFSKAKGSAPNRPKNRKRRGLAGVALKWAAQVSPRSIFLENVEEFKEWGPLLDGQPDPQRKGQHFRRFVARLRNLGYDVDWRELIAADYGAPTSRKRFFLIARNDGEPIVWPEPTHGPSTTAKQGRRPCRNLKPYRTAAECIDWSIPTVSIFATKAEYKAQGLKCIRPLAENTLRRIARGVWKFILNNPHPYLLNDQQTAAFMGYHYTGKDGYDLRRPLKTVTMRDHHTLVAALLTKYHAPKGPESRCYDLFDPINTIDTGNRFGLVSANLITIDHTKSSPDNRAHPVDRPIRTITLRNNHALVSTYITKFRGTNLGSETSEPLQTITAGGNHAGLVSAFLMKYYGQGIGQQANEPLATAKTKDTFALVTVAGKPYYIRDIGLRMLQPHELALAQGFPENYVLTGNKTSKIGRIGNSVPPQCPEAIIRANVTWNEAAEAAAA